MKWLFFVMKFYFFQKQPIFFDFSTKIRAVCKKFVGKLLLKKTSQDNYHEKFFCFKLNFYKFIYKSSICCGNFYKKAAFRQIAYIDSCGLGLYEFFTTNSL